MIDTLSLLDCPETPWRWNWDWAKVNTVEKKTIFFSAASRRKIDLVFVSSQVPWRAENIVTLISLSGENPAVAGRIV